MPQSPPPPLDPKVAELLRAVPFGAPPAGAKGRVRSQLKLAGVVGTFPAGIAEWTTNPSLSEAAHGLPDKMLQTVVDATARSVPKVMAAKPALSLLAGIAVGTAGAMLVLSRPASQPAQRAQEDIVRSLPSAFLSPIPLVEMERPEVDGTVPSPAPPSSASRSSSPLKKSPSVETLGQEQKLLARARAALGRSELETAMQELDRHNALFPNGTLNEEREALRIVTLARQGNVASARECADRFRRAFPRSIQLGTVNAAVAGRP